MTCGKRGAEQFVITAERVADMEPGSAEWATKATASKVAAIVGLSPYESRFQLWHRMRGTLPWEVDNDILRRGNYLEPAIRCWFADQHPSWVVDSTGAWANRDRPWQVATPDSLILKRDLDRTPHGLLEIKTALGREQWGEEGTDDIPPGYRAQVLWQMDTLGLPVCWVAVLTAHLEFRQYQIGYDAEDAAWLRGEVEQFMASLADDDAEPDVDSSEHTYSALRQLHPDIDGTKVDLNPATAAAYIDAVRAQKDARRNYVLARNQVAAEMGLAEVAEFGGTTYATRISKQGGTPYVQTARGLITKEASMMS
ncbi:MAG: YqaJ viral recombinase family protein [Nocardioides sp.]